ncbi:hypothetical protein ONZ51_g1634 [Trametes cubensis]|uniref:Ubiquinol-cytochrome c chaperone domain-containing protein n=1 Tax=Trametes cubensis TaxID=1111947 RepID=A0AAD7U3E8_9APHY|nr:hypothetical protein ONZ51_g1634 [Trametes cubensis]
MLGRSLSLAHAQRSVCARHARALTSQASSSSSSTPSSPPSPSTPPSSSSSPQTPNKQPASPQQAWLTKTIRQSPVAKSAFLALAGLLGYGSTKQYAGRRAFNMYSELCVPRADNEAAFWKKVITAVLGQFFLVRGVLYHVSMFGAPELRNGASDGGSFRQVSERGMTEVLEDLIRQNTENCIFKFLTPTSVFVIAFSLCLVQRYLEFLLTRLLAVTDAFISPECHLPPTFQSWFTVTNLHVWLLTVRLRALPTPHGQNYVQGLIDHFFIDIEDRVRAVLQPVSPGSLAPPQNLAPYTSRSDFYRIANAMSKKNAKGRTPESLVTRQMKIFKEQWAGMGMSFDLGLVRSDAELAAAVWRNLLGARGARGIAYPDPDGVSADPRAHFRRAVNIAGGSVEKLSRLEKNRGALEAEERRDDGSGVHDFPPAEADKYVAYPETMATVVEYVRRELVRLERVPDELIIGKGIIGTEGHDLEALRFGPVKDADGLTAALRQAQ